MNHTLPHGVITALTTPFLSNGEIDFASFEKLIQTQLDAGIAAVIPCGTTGESPTLSVDEKKILISKTVELCKKSTTAVIAGTGSNSTQESITLSTWAQNAGVQGLLIVTPYYNKPTAVGLEAHFTQIANSISIPMMLYNVPGRTGISLTATTVAQLATHKNITSIKEASGNVNLASEIITQTLPLKKKLHKNFDLFSGDDSLFLPLLSIGGKGVVSVASNLLPKEMVALWKFYEAQDFTQAQNLHLKYFKVFSDLFIESNPAPVKWALAQKGILKNHLRLPLVPLSKKSEELLLKTLTEAGIL